MGNLSYQGTNPEPRTAVTPLETGAHRRVLRFPRDLDAGQRPGEPPPHLSPPKQAPTRSSAESCPAERLTEDCHLKSQRCRMSAPATHPAEEKKDLITRRAPKAAPPSPAMTPKTG